jgi:Mlc titration factor MtfA (ptsG expression regulator)
MAEICPHCGADLPLIQDAFCPECRNELHEVPALGAGFWGGDPQPLPTRALPDEWETFLTRNLAHDRLLSEAQRARLRQDTLTFVETKWWEGCAGLPMTDEIRVTVAAQACLMLLGLSHDCFSRVRSILVYPSSFMVPDGNEPDEKAWGGAVAGQAVGHGPVILAWDKVLAEGRDPSGGDNLVIHEFAHQLDYLDGYLEGTLGLVGAAAERWRTVLDAEYNRLRKDVRKGRNTFLGEYAATNKTEFFAVASERFFTLPAPLRRHHPSLYESLVEGYGIDPGKWFEVPSAESRDAKTMPLSPRTPSA